MPSQVRINIELLPNRWLVRLVHALGLCLINVPRRIRPVIVVRLKQVRSTTRGQLAFRPYVRLAYRPRHDDAQIDIQRAA